MPITLDGTLGITTPALTVTGASTFTGNISTAGNLVFTTTGDRIIGDFSNATVANRVSFQTSTTNGNTSIPVLPNGTATVASHLYYEGTDPANSSFFQVGTIAAEQTLRADKQGTGSYRPITFYTSGSERMRIDTSGNVGIGTNSPNFGGNSVALAVNGATSSALNLKVADVGAFTASSGSGYSTVADTRASTVMGFTVGASERMRIDAAGNVGIGTVGPSQKLDVVGNIITSQSITIGSNGLYQAGSIYSDSNWGMLFRAKQASPAVAEYKWSNAADTERMRIDTSGNVGIGQPTPTANLHVRNTGGNTTFKLEYGAGGTQSNIIGANSEMSLQVSGSSIMTFYTNSAEVGRFNSSGHFLVGCTAVPNVGATPDQYGFSVSAAEVVISKNTSGTTPAIYVKTSSGANKTAITFYNGINQVGSISTSTTNTSFNPSSDRRLKDNITPIVNGLERVSKLKPVDYTWKADGVKDNGFIAQDLLETAEFANRVNPIGKAEDGSDLYGVDYMKFVSVLTAAIQELNAEVQSLKQQLGK